MRILLLSLQLLLKLSQKETNYLNIKAFIMKQSLSPIKCSVNVIQSSHILNDFAYACIENILDMASRGQCQVMERILQFQNGLQHLCVCTCMCMYGVCDHTHACPSRYVKVREQLYGISSLSTFPWVLGLSTVIRLVQQVLLPLGHLVICFPNFKPQESVYIHYIFSLSLFF